jgi:hypothetical protein
MESLVQEKRVNNLKGNMLDIAGRISDPSHPALRKPELVERGIRYSALRMLAARFGEIVKTKPSGAKEFSKFEYDPAIFVKQSLEEVDDEVKRIIAKMAKETGRDPDAIDEEYEKHKKEYGSVRHLV